MVGCWFSGATERFLSQSRNFHSTLALEIVTSFDHVCGIQFPFPFQSLYQQSRHGLIFSCNPINNSAFGSKLVTITENRFWNVCFVI